MRLAERTTVKPERDAGRRLRVLWLIKGLDPGGAELLLSMMAKVRDREAFDYEAAYLLPWKDGLVKELEGQGVTVHCLDGGREWDLRWAFRLLRLVRASGYDIVHVHSPYVAGIARLALRTLPRNVRPRIVYTEHVPWWGYAAPSRFLNAVTFGLDDACVAVSRAVLDSIPPRRRRRAKVVVQGIDVDAVRKVRRSRQEERGRLGIAPEEILVGTVAHFRPQKAYPDLLRAARLVLDAHPSVRFIAVGRGPEEARIRGLHGDLGLGDRFRFVGFRSDATQVLAACDIFALASLFEGLPLAVMEALTLGIPVVSTNVGGLPEAVTDRVEGMLVPPSRPELLAGAIETMVRDPAMRMRMSKAAAARGRTFDIRGSARAVEASYREVVAG